MTTKIIITPANHGAVKGAAIGGTPRTVRVVTVGGPPNGNRTHNKTLMTVPLPAPAVRAVQANRGEVRTVFKRVYSTSESPSRLSMMSSAPRKRQRLDHLTSDQKNQRRKLKNRVAAQTARDRKKLQMDLLESRVASLERQNDELLQQNTFLQKQNDLLSQQNALLLQRLEPPATAAAAASAPTSVESAALISGPQQKGQEGETARRAAALLALSLLSWAAFQVTLATAAAHMLIYSTSSRKQSSAVKSRLPEARRPPALLWWGPQQKSWSPAMIR